MGGVFVLMSLLSLIATYLHLSEQFSFIRFVMPVPYTHELLENFSLWFIPSYIFYAITGSFLVFGISKLLESINSKFLLFWGQNSLIIYCMHFIILEILIRIVCYMIIPSNAILSSLFFIVIFLATILLCNILIYLINTSVLKIFVGK